MIVSYLTLPKIGVVTVGNIKYTYREYRTSMKRQAESKADPSITNNRQIFPHFLRSGLTDRSFRVKLSLPSLDRPGAKDLPEAKDRVLVRLDIDPKDGEVIQNQQFEIILFVDTVFSIEEERGYLPFNCPIGLQELPPGERVITANVITFGDQIGVGSRKVKVVK